MTVSKTVVSASMACVSGYPVARNGDSKVTKVAPFCGSQNLIEVAVFKSRQQQTCVCVCLSETLVITLSAACPVARLQERRRGRLMEMNWLPDPSVFPEASCLLTMIMKK